MARFRARRAAGAPPSSRSTNPLMLALLAAAISMGVTSTLSFSVDSRIDSALPHSAPTSVGPCLGRSSDRSIGCLGGSASAPPPSPTYWHAIASFAQHHLRELRDGAAIVQGGLVGSDIGSGFPGHQQTWPLLDAWRDAWRRPPPPPPPWSLGWLVPSRWAAQSRTKEPGSRPDAWLGSPAAGMHAWKKDFLCLALGLLALVALPALLALLAVLGAAVARLARRDRRKARKEAWRERVHARDRARAARRRRRRALATGPSTQLLHAIADEWAGTSLGAKVRSMAAATAAQALGLARRPTGARAVAWRRRRRAYRRRARHWARRGAAYPISGKPPAPAAAPRDPL